MRSLNTFQFIVTHPLNSSRKLKSVWRFLPWQVGSRILPGPVAVDFVNGSRLLVKPGMTGATGSVYTGLHEFEDMAFVQRMSDYGFAPYTYNPFRRELLALKTKNSASGNTVYIRDLKEVLGRIRNSPIVSLNGKQF
jgi:hypothetical protein